ncbi:unnamed protein product [Owenia fusiformis]|uniref:Uncharacterized protein n=1 Tax=Owenia fusiformis TaxID=6347 RepID=A0A8J1URC5_OWEFU|nr:unnamed protein product [Owenia fusiformis]
MDPALEKSCLDCVRWHMYSSYDSEFCDGCFERLREVGTFDQAKVLQAMGLSGLNGTNQTKDDLIDYVKNIYDTQLAEQALAKYLYIYISPILLFIGTFGNILAAIVLTKMSIKSCSTCVYLAVTAIIDLLVLYIKCGNDWLYNLNGTNLSNILLVYSDTVCKVYPFAFNFIAHLAIWVLVALAVETFIMCGHPEKVRKMCTIERVRAILLLLTVLLVFVNVHFFWSFAKIPLSESFNPGTDNGQICTWTNKASEEFQSIMWPIMDLIIAEVVPYVIIVILITLAGLKLLKQKSKSAVEILNEHKYSLNPDAIIQLRKTFLIILVLHLILTIPKFSFYIYKYFVEVQKMRKFDREYQSQTALANAICSELVYGLLSCKFFIYAGTCKKFRHELKSILTLVYRIHRRKSNRRKSEQLMGKPILNKGILQKFEDDMRNGGINAPQYVKYDTDFTPPDETLEPLSKPVEHEEIITSV